jgi:hypothetical protein
MRSKEGTGERDCRRNADAAQIVPCGVCCGCLADKRTDRRSGWQAGLLLEERDGVRLVGGRDGCCLCKPQWIFNEAATACRWEKVSGTGCGQVTVRRSVGSMWTGSPHTNTFQNLLLLR